MHRDKETLERWKMLALAGIAALCFVSGLVLPLVHPSLHNPLRSIAAIALSGLLTWWCAADAVQQGWQVFGEDRRLLSWMVVFVPALAIPYYIYRSRGLRGGAPIAGKALLFALLMFALFETTRQFSTNVFSR